MSYANDVVMMAKEKGDIRAMLSRLDSYLDRKGLEPNEGTTKVMRVRRGG